MERLPPPVIQVPPLGLLGLLGLKNGGVNPQFLGDRVSPTLDLLDLYRTSNRQNAQVIYPQATGISGFGVPQSFSNINANLTVPQGEWWYVSSASFTMTCTGADTCAMFRGVLFPFGVGPQHAIGLARDTNGEPACPGGGQSRMIAVLDFWMPPGSRLGFAAAGTFGVVGTQMDCNAFFARFPV